MEQLNLIPPSLAEKLPAMVRNELAKEPPGKVREFVEEYSRKAKSTGVAYLLWFIGGWHYAYLRKWGFQVLYWVTLGGLLVWVIVDLFRIPRLIGDYNKDIAMEVPRNQKAISS
jgi:hypothetical protein